MSLAIYFSQVEENSLKENRACVDIFPMRRNTVKNFNFIHILTGHKERVYFGNGQAFVSFFLNTKSL